MNAAASAGIKPTAAPIDVAVGILMRPNGDVLLGQRPSGKPYAGYWEFPGGKLEPGETVEQALERELREELGVRVTAREVLEVATHDYPHGPAVEVHFVRCDADSHAFVLGPGVHEVRWVAPREVEPAEVLAADRAFLARLAARA